MKKIKAIVLKCFGEECKYVIKEKRTSEFLLMTFLLIILIEKILMKKLNMKIFLEKYQNFSNLDTRKLHFPKYKKFFQSGFVWLF